MYRARRPFEPLKLYRLIEGKFILLRDELEEEEEEDVEEDDDVLSDSDTSRPVAGESDNTSENGDSGPSIDDAKASPYFRGLHRSKGIFRLATRPNQMGSWSTAGAMLTLGSEMPWFCCVDEHEWKADEETQLATRKDFEGEWGDRRQELVLIGEKLDVEGLIKLIDNCLLSRAEMRKWEKVMHDSEMDEDEKEEKLTAMRDDGYWAEWPRVEEVDHNSHDHHGHSYAH